MHSTFADVSPTILAPTHTKNMRRGIMKDCVCCCATWFVERWQQKILNKQKRIENNTPILVIEPLLEYNKRGVRITNFHPTKPAIITKLTFQSLTVPEHGKTEYAGKFDMSIILFL